MTAHEFTVSVAIRVTGAVVVVSVCSVKVRIFADSYSRIVFIQIIGINIGTIDARRLTVSTVIVLALMSIMGGMTAREQKMARIDAAMEENCIIQVFLRKIYNLYSNKSLIHVQLRYDVGG